MTEPTPLRLDPLRRLLLTEEELAVASTARFRAVERRLTWRAVRAAMMVIALGAPVHSAVLALLHPADAAPIALVNGALGAAAVVTWWGLGGALRHWPELAISVMSLALAAGVMLLALSGPHVVELAIGYVLFLPPVVALVIPWRTWTEVRWLAVYGISAIVFLATVAPTGLLAPSDRLDLIFAFLVVASVALTGNLLMIRRQVVAFAQVQRLGRLQRQEMHHRSELQRAHRLLQLTARTDALTGAGNRLKLNEDLGTARGRMARTGRRFGLLEVDLDHFKAVNDAFGHLAGDEVLRQVATTLRNAARSDDSVHRYGGEEFLVILGDVSGGVLAAGERVRAAIENLGLVHPSNAPFACVTVSVGAAVIGPPDAAATNDEWFHRVDIALYLAKSEGRNRVVVAPPTPPSRPPTPPSLEPRRADAGRLPVVRRVSPVGTVA